MNFFSNLMEIEDFVDWSFFLHEEMGGDILFMEFFPLLQIFNKMNKRVII